MSEVSLPRWVFVSLLGALAGSSLTAMFLAGRLSASEPKPTPSPATNRVLPSETVASPTEAPVVPPPLSGQSPSVAMNDSAPPAATPIGLADCSDPASVLQYLREMEAAVSSGKTWEDPTQLAQTIVADALAGRTAGLDTLIASSAAVLVQIDDTAVPSSCVDCTTHKAETRETLRASLTLLESMRTGIATGDLTALMGAQTEAARLEARARKVEALDEQLRSRCGG